jgi:HK97 family phage major capsid protein
MLRLADLQERRATLIKEMRAIADSPGGEGGDLSAEQQTEFDKRKAELATVEKNIARVQALDEAERRMAGTPVHGAGDELERELRQFSLARLLASTFEPSVDAGRERDVCAEQRRRTGRAGDGLLIPFECLVPQRRQEQRTLLVSGDAANLVSTQVLGNEFIDALRPMSVASRLGARTITGLSADIGLPRRDNRNPAAAWFAEDAAIGSADQSFDQVTGTPRHLGMITSFSRKTLLQSAAPGIEALTREHLLQELGVGVDLAVMKGTGAPQPTGITNTANINTRNASGAAPDWASVRAVVAAVEAADVPMDGLGWALNAHLKSKLGTVTKVSGDAGAGFILSDDGTLAGAPVAVTSQLSGNPLGGSPQEGEAIFGRWPEAIIAMFSGAEILVNPYESTAYSKGHISVRAIIDCDVLIRHPAAFNHWRNLDVTVS